MDHDIDWQVQQENISERAQYILKTGLWSDCQFFVGNDKCKKEFKAHKLILSMASPVFEKMFQKCFSETHNGVEIVDIQPEAFGAMLSYVYGDVINLQSFDQACELCYVANKYMMPNLLKHCTSYIWQDVNVSNACRGYEFAELFDQQSLKEKCREIIITQTSEVISQASFVDVEMTTLKMILEEESLSIHSEMELFEAVKKWTEAEFQRLGEGDDVDQRSTIYDELVPKLCFLDMQPKEFAEGPAVSALLTKDQSFAILMNITSRSCEYPMPQGFTTRVRRINIEHTSGRMSVRLNLENFTPTYNVSPTESTLLFSCNKDIKMLGVMIMCQLPHFKGPSPELQTRFKKYKENVDIYIQDLSTDVCKESSFNFTVEYRSTIEVLFPHPVLVLRKRKYKLGVVLNQQGLYMAGTCVSSELIHQTVKFNFFDTFKPTFIHGIIFS